VGLSKKGREVFIMPLRQENRKYTYADYIRWTERERWEIIDGVPYMQAAPSWEHQRILAQLGRQFLNYFQGKPCETYLAPFDVMLSEGNEADEDIETTVQPDITVICDKSKLKGTGYFGVPTLVIEILSPSTAAFDKKFKMKRYGRVGVKEVWIIDPSNKIVDVFKLVGDGRYGQPETYSTEDKIVVSLFPEFEIELNTVFSAV
jgi:Uma2 family endonuclease